MIDGVGPYSLLFMALVSVVLEINLPFKAVAVSCFPGNWGFKMENLSLRFLTGGWRNHIRRNYCWTSSSWWKRLLKRVKGIIIKVQFHTHACPFLQGTPTTCFFSSFAKRDVLVFRSSCELFSRCHRRTWLNGVCFSRIGSNWLFGQGGLGKC